MGPDIEDAPQDVKLLECDFQIRGVRNAALLGLDRNGERHQQD